MFKSLLLGSLLKQGTNITTGDCCANESDFEIVVFPDTQNMVEQNLASGKAMADWVAANKDIANIKAVLHVGDITNNPFDVQFQRADVWFKAFEDKGIPFLYTAGNHDYQPGWSIPGRNLTLFNTYFGPSRYTGKPFYISSVTPTRGESSAVRFSAGSKKFVAVSLELFPRQDTIDWATALLTSLYASEPDTEVIIVTHGYIDYRGEIADATAVYSTNFYSVTDGLAPSDLYTTFIKKMPNIRYVIGGHFLIPNVNAMKGLIEKITSIGDSGNTIHQIFVNYQDDNRTGVSSGVDFTPGGGGGNGFLMRMKFSPKNNTVNFTFFSPILGINDPLAPGFTLNTVTGLEESIDTLAIEKNLVVKDEARFQGKVAFESLTRWRIPFVSYDHTLKTLDNLKYDETTNTLTLDAKILAANVPEYTDNAAAVTAGIPVNRIYRTGDILKIVHV